MSVKRSVMIHGEFSSTSLEPGWLSGANTPSATGKHVNGAGTRGGSAAVPVFTTLEVRTPYRPDIPWEEAICEHSQHISNTTSGNWLRWRKSGTTTVAEIQWTGGTLGVSHRNQISNLVGSEATAVWVVNTVMWAQHLITLDASAGVHKTWIDGTLILNNTGLNNTGGASDCNGLQLSSTAGGQTQTVDDLIARPRCVLVDGVSSADSATPTDISGGGESATVYAWENDSADSAGGAGDPTLAAGMWRLYLRDVSFGPEETGVGWADNDAVTVTGLTGTILVHAPHAGYACGLEPGGQFFGNRLYIEEPASWAAGTNNSAGTLTGSASDRLDALDTAGDSKTVQHTADAEAVGLSPAVIVNQSAVAEIVGFVVSARAQSDGASPNAIILRQLDNGSEVSGPPIELGASLATVSTVITETAAGGAWAVGTGAGGADDREDEYETATVV